MQAGLALPASPLPHPSCLRSPRPQGLFARPKRGPPGGAGVVNVLGAIPHQESARSPMRQMSEHGPTVEPFPWHARVRPDYQDG
jgi:hypothetical protein